MTEVLILLLEDAVESPESFYLKIGNSTISLENDAIEQALSHWSLTRLPEHETHCYEKTNISTITGPQATFKDPSDTGAPFIRNIASNASFVAELKLFTFQDMTHPMVFVRNNSSIHYVHLRTEDAIVELKNWNVTRIPENALYCHKMTPPVATSIMSVPIAEPLIMKKQNITLDHSATLQNFTNSDIADNLAILRNFTESISLEDVSILQNLKEMILLDNLAILRNLTENTTLENVATSPNIEESTTLATTAEAASWADTHPGATAVIAVTVVMLLGLTSWSVSSYFNIAHHNKNPDHFCISPLILLTLRCFNWPMVYNAVLGGEERENHAMASLRDELNGITAS